MCDYIRSGVIRQLKESTINEIKYLDESLRNKFVVPQIYQTIICFPDRISITHVIQPLYSSTRYRVFFSDKENSTILYDIYENKVIVNHYHLNLNISRDLFENSTRTISYFIHPKEFKNGLRNYSEPTNEPIKNYTQVNNNQNNSSTGSILSNTFFMILISVLLSFFNNL
ncbi:hypothetical protein ACTA71_007619 [Dictyostelium dimigraforme]